MTLSRNLSILANNVSSTGGLTGQTLTSPTINTPIMGGSVITSGTSQASTSGTSIDFTGIPSWVKRITVMFNGVSTNGTSVVQIQLGTSSGIENTGYLGSSSTIQTTVTTGVNSTGLNIMNGIADWVTFYGQMVISLLNGNTYVSSHVAGNSNTIPTTFLGGGTKALAGALTQLRVTTANGTDTFDAGSINILYE